MDDVEEMLREACVTEDIAYNSFNAIMTESVMQTPQSSPTKSPYSKHRKRFVITPH